MQGGETLMTVVLETTGLDKSFGGVKVIDDLSVQAQRRRSAGHRRAERRRQDDALQPRHRRVSARRGSGRCSRARTSRTWRGRTAAALGIGRTFQIPKPFADMSVFENVLVCAAYGRGMSERASYQRCVETLELTRLCRTRPTSGGRPAPARPQAARAGQGARRRSQRPAARRDRRRPHRERGRDAHRHDQGPARGRHLDHLDRAHRPRPARGRRPHLRHQLRRACSSRATPTRSCAATRCRPATWGGRRYEHPRAQGRRRLLRRLPGPLLGHRSTSRRARRSPSSAPTAAASPRCCRTHRRAAQAALRPGAVPGRAGQRHPRPHARRAWASPWSPRGAACSPASASARTC